MMVYIALLRAVNVGGTTKLPMAELKALCSAAGFSCVETYIASGNVVFASAAAPAVVKAELQKRLLKFAGKPVGVLLRTAAEMKAVLKANPFADTASNLTYALFLDEKPAKNALEKVSGLKNEQMALGKREIYIHYPEGMGKSRLKIPAASTGTARNMNTVAALVQMASKP
jgi:uncharacterized protein (DUF1697 family)